MYTLFIIDTGAPCLGIVKRRMESHGDIYLYNGNKMYIYIYIYIHFGNSPCALTRLSSLLIMSLRWVWMASSVTKRFDRAYGVCGDTARSCVLQANRIAARTVLLLMVAMVLGIDWLASWYGSSCHVADFEVPCGFVWLGGGF